MFALKLRFIKFLIVFLSIHIVVKRSSEKFAVSLKELIKKIKQKVTLCIRFIKTRENSNVHQLRQRKKVKLSYFYVFSLSNFIQQKKLLSNQSNKILSLNFLFENFHPFSFHSNRVRFERLLKEFF